MSDENNFKPTLEGYKPLRPFNLFMKNNFPFIENTFEALDTYGLLCEIVKYLNVAIENVNTTEENISLLNTAFDQLNDYVSHYFDNLDVQEEINNKLDEMVQSGTLEHVLSIYFSDLENNIEDNFNRVYTMIGAVSSGSPAGTYATASDLATADPDHSKIYLVLADGKWYYYNTSNSSWTAGGTYQGTSVSTTDPTILSITNKLNNAFTDYYNLVKDENIYVSGGGTEYYRVYLTEGATYYYNQLAGSMYGINVKNSSLQQVGTFNQIVDQIAWNTTFTCPEGVYCIDIPVNASYNPYVRS